MAPFSKVIMGVLYNDIKLFDLAKENLKTLGWQIQRQSEVYDFDQTNYYEAEMGTGLKRCFMSLEGLIELDSAADWKLKMVKLEQEFAENGNRKINLDPGYLDLKRVVLLSGKEGPQKIYLRNGVWADLVLMKSKGGYREMDWTFPDLRGARYDDFFLKVRADFKIELKSNQTLKNPA